MALLPAGTAYPSWLASSLFNKALCTTDQCTVTTSKYASTCSLAYVVCQVTVTGQSLPQAWLPCIRLHAECILW